MQAVCWKCKGPHWAVDHKGVQPVLSTLKLKMPDTRVKLVKRKGGFTVAPRNVVPDKGVTRKVAWQSANRERYNQYMKEYMGKRRVNAKDK